MLDKQNQGPQCWACGSPMKLSAIEPSCTGQNLRTFFFAHNVFNESFSSWAFTTRSSQQPENVSAHCRSARNLKPQTSSSVLVFWRESKMNTRVTTLAALISSVLLSNVQQVAAQTTPPPATATRPAKTPPDQTSVPNASPPATTTQTTGESNQGPTVKKMNEDEKQKVDKTGK
jgi:hypothetical protein